MQCIVAAAVVEACRSFSIASDAQCSSVNRTSTRQADYFATRRDAPIFMPPVFDSLHWASPDNLPSWVGLEYCWLHCKRIDAFPRFCTVTCAMAVPILGELPL